MFERRNQCDLSKNALSEFSDKTFERRNQRKFNHQLFSSMNYSEQLLNHETLVFSFICNVAAPQQTLGHCKRSKLANPMLITAFYLIIDPRVTGNLVARLGPKAGPSTQWDLNRQPSGSSVILQLIEVLSPKTNGPILNVVSVHVSDDTLCNLIYLKVREKVNYRR